MIETQGKQAINIALYKILGGNSLTEHEHMIPFYNLVMGVFIGIRVGVTDVHTAKLVQAALDLPENDPLLESVITEIMNAVE
jgi:hypothetical protein